MPTHQSAFSYSLLPTLLFTLTAGPSYAPAQGTITVANGSYAFARTNAIGMGGTVGNTAPALGGFYYAVFTASSTVTSIDASFAGSSDTNLDVHRSLCH